MTVLTILIMMALLATVVSPVWGIGSTAHGGRFDEKHSSQLMSACFFVGAGSDRDYIPRLYIQNHIYISRSEPAPTYI